jgi:hypothetical protein
MLHRFIEIINDLELSHRFIALNTFSIPGDSLVNPKRTFWMMIYFNCYRSHYIHDF